MGNLDLIGSRRLAGGRSRAAHRVARLRRYCALLGLLTLVAAAPPRGKEPGSATPGTSTYRVGPGDVLNVEVVGRRDLSTQYTVGQDGVLFLPLTGALAAEGKTAAELSAELARRLSLYDRDITQVNVSIAEFRSRKIFVLGAVLRPGTISFAQLPNAWDAIREAGGPAEDAVLTSVEIIPSDQSAGRQTQIVDIAAALREGRAQTLEKLRPGDTVRVPRALPGAIQAPTSNSVSLFGAITRQGAIPLERQTDLMSAIASSGGPTPDANLSKIQIVRKNGARAVHMKVNLNDYIDKANPAGNPMLMAGDTVFLPREGTGGFMSFVRTISPILALASTVVLIVRR